MMQFNLKSVLRFVAVVCAVGVWSGAQGQTYYNMSTANYSQNFNNIANTTAWPNGFNGTESQMWRGLAVNETGTIPSALRITTATNLTFTTGTSGGVQKGSGNIQLLSTGSTNNTSSAAIELYLNFTGRTAGTLSFNAAQVGNSTGNRVGTLRVYASTDGTTYSELTATGLPFVATNNVASSAAISVALPAGFTNSATARLRFYYHNGTGGSTGSRPKISIDNILVTSTPAGSTVTFDANGGTGTMANQTASVSTPLTANAFTRAGFTFSGWNTAANGSGTAYADGANFPFTANATLYAQWTLITTPTIVLSESSISGLDYQLGSGPSDNQTFTASGSSLTANIVLTAPTNFHISINATTGFGPSLTLTQTGGNVGATTIYVRLIAGLAINTYSGNLTATSTGATTQSLGLSGAVTPAAPANDNCSGAIALSVGSTCTFSTFTNVNATNSSAAPAPGCGSYSGPDVWFSVEVPASGNLEIETAAGGITDGAMALYSGNCGALTLIECDDDDGPGIMPAISATGLTPGATIYILFWEYGGNQQGTFDISVSNPVATGYCSSSFTEDDADAITNVSINTLNNNSGDAHAGNANGYQDFTALPATDLQQTQTYTLTVSIDPNGAFVYDVWAFFDWDGDLDFDSPIDEAYDLGDRNSIGSLSTTITVPAGAALGNTRMRIIMINANTPVACDPQPWDYGETEDYTVNVVPFAINPEPSNHVTGFDCLTISSGAIDLVWIDATGPNLPSGYLILWSVDGYGNIPNPVDGTPVVNGTNALNVPYGIAAASIAGLTQNTQYFFQIFPYSNSGSNINYKTDGTVPGSDCETDEGPCVFESFENTTASTSTGYNSGSYGGDNGETWSFVESQEAQARGYGIDGKGLILRRQSSSSSISTTFSSGISDFSCRLRKAYTGSGNRQVELFINGVSYGSSITFGGSSGADATIVPFNVSNIDIAGSGTIEIRNITNNQVTIDDISWTCFDGCTPTHHVGTFLPSSGPAGTRVTITGSGFTWATGVSFSEINALAFEVVDDNTIIAQVPEGHNNGAIRIAVDGCEATSSTQFTFLTDNDNCGSGGGGAATDLFISEVYDSEDGSLSYIEVFNGTLGTVNLGAGNYSIRIRTGTSTDNDFAMSGNLASGATYVLRLGSDAPICSGLSVQNNQPSAGGFNGNDQIFLRKNNADLDYVPNPNHPNAGGTGSNFTGFSQIRKSTVTSPTTTYNASEWDEFATENCNDLGAPPYLPSGNDINISAQPQDVDCSALALSVSATSTNGFPGSGAYTWRYNAPGTDTWELVSALHGSNGITVTGSNTPSITISGNTAILLDYQFYVDIGASGSPQCRRYSNAARYTYDTRLFYRTRPGATNYTDLSSWEMSNSEGSGYTTAVCQYPVAFNSDKVIIQSGHEVTVTGINLALDWLDIEAGATFNMNNGGLTINNGNLAGPDLEVEGTYVDRMTTGTGNGISFSSGATWSMAPDATIIKTNTSSVNNYRDHYETGIANIPATAYWIFRREAANDLSVSTIGMYYPNLTFENEVLTTYNPSNTQYFFDGSTGGTARIKGDLNIGGDGPGNYVVRTNNFNNSPIIVEGALIIRSGSTFTNNHAAGTNDGTGLEVRGNLEIDGTLNLSANGTNPQRGQLLLTGANDQIGTGDGNISINRLEINKSAGQIYTESKITVAQNAVFTNGVLEFDDSVNDAYLELSSTATHSGASENSFVDGRVRKIGFTAGNEFEFPVGYYDTLALPVLQVYQPAALTPEMTSSTAAFEMQYFHENFTPGYENPNNRPPRDGSLEAGTVSTCNYWMIDRVAPGTDAQVKLSWNTDECLTIDDPDLLVVARWEDTEGVEEWQNTSLTNPLPTNSVSGVQGWIETGHFVDNFSPFAIGSAGFSLNVLPISLLSFTAEAVDNRVVECRWATASEVNNDFFSVERSKDGEAWEVLGTVAGAGNNHSTLHYSFADDAPYEGLSYYRLRQTDFDGSSSLSQVEVVHFDSASAADGFALLHAYRSDAGLAFSYRATAPYLRLEVYDVSGRLIYGNVISNDDVQEGLVDLHLARGVYLLRISDNQGHSAARRFFY
jgi:uncharacterized repeat protein (TIGR02543 family)